MQKKSRVFFISSKLLSKTDDVPKKSAYYERIL